MSSERSGMEDIKAMLRGLQESQAFSDRASEQLGEELVALGQAVHTLDQRLTALETRLQGLIDKTDTVVANEPPPHSASAEERAAYLGGLDTEERA